MSGTTSTAVLSGRPISALNAPSALPAGTDVVVGSVVIGGQQTAVRIPLATLAQAMAQLGILAPLASDGSLVIGGQSLVKVVNGLIIHGTTVPTTDPGVAGAEWLAGGVVMRSGG